MPSTNAKPSLYRQAFSDTVLDSVTGYNELDPLSWDLHRFLNALTVFSVYRWQEGDRLPTVAYRAHGTTSTWWIILALNGLTSLHELQPGMLLRIPSLDQIEAARLNVAASTRVPRLITI